MVISPNQNAAQYPLLSPLPKTQHNTYGHVPYPKGSTIPMVMSPNQTATQYLWYCPLPKTQHNTYGHIT